MLPREGPSLKSLCEPQPAAGAEPSPSPELGTNLAITLKPNLTTECCLYQLLFVLMYSGYECSLNTNPAIHETNRPDSNGEQYLVYQGRSKKEERAS